MSKRIAIITDSSSTIKPHEYDDVFVVPILITVNNAETYQDGAEIDSKKIAELLKPVTKFVFRGKGNNIKTSMPPPQFFVDQVTQIASKYERVICLPLSSGLSGTYQQWKQLLTSESLAKYKNVFVYDTCDIAISLRWLVEDVMKLSKQTDNFDEIEKFINEWPLRIDCIVVLENLSQLVEGGRIKKMQAMIASLLKIKPIVHFHGENEFFARAFSNKVAIEKGFLKLVEDLKISNFNDLERIGVCSNITSETDNKLVLSEIVACAQALFKKTDLNIKSKLFTASVPAIISAHTGIDSFSIQLLKRVNGN